MDPLPQQPEKRRRADTILIAVFMLLIWLPTVDTFFHTDISRPTDEKRIPAEFPKLESGPRSLQKYLIGLETYFNDHFGYRNRLVRFNNRWRWTFFRDRSTRNVIVGSEGWLYITDEKMVEHYRGVQQFTPQDLEDWQKLLESRRDWLAKRGIKYLFVIAPNKESIYPEYLPAWMTKARPQTKLDQFFEYMRAHSTVEVLDLRPALLEAKKDGPIYLKTDTHWNALGAFIAYQQVVNSLTKMLPDFKPVPPSEFEHTYCTAPGGDLAGALGLIMTESNSVKFTPGPKLPPLEMTPEILPHPLPVIFITNAAATNNLVIIHDSFGRAWSRYLGYNFNHVTFLWQGNLDTNWITREKPVVVIHEMVERFFNVQKPRDFMAVEALK